MECLNNRCWDLEGLSEVEKASQWRQNQLFIHLNKAITSSTLQDIKQLVSGVYLEDGELERCNTMNDILKVLFNRCVITMGHYEMLKKLLVDAGVNKHVRDVEKAENDIRDISRTAFHDDPSHVKALKKHCEKICSALQKGSTLADVTEVLKRQKILDDQHQIGGSGPEAVRELLDIVMNKRNKSLTAMTVLVCALLRAGHEELVRDILTTQYSREREAGRYVRIPWSMRRILNGYLQITEDLSEPDLHLVLDHLVSKATVSEDERAAILQQPSRVEKVQEMLDTLLSGDREDAVDSLYNALLLAEQDDLADSMPLRRPVSWRWLAWGLQSRYRYDQRELIHDISIRNEPIKISWERDPSPIITQQTTATRNTTEERVVPWKVTDSRHGSFLKSLICGQWVKSGQREWGGYKAVIDIETLEEVLRNHAMKGGQTALEILASMPDVPKETLFILNVTQRPDLKTKWKRLLTGELFPDAKVLLFESSAGQGITRGGKKRKLNGCSCELNGEGIGAQGSALNFCPVS